MENYSRPTTYHDMNITKRARPVPIKPLFGSHQQLLPSKVDPYQPIHALVLVNHKCRHPTYPAQGGTLDSTASMLVSSLWGKQKIFPHPGPRPSWFHLVRLSFILHPSIGYISSSRPASRCPFFGIFYTLPTFLLCHF